MGARLYVGNLSYETQAQGLRGLVEEVGHPVADVHIVTDRETGRSRGFAFVELSEPENLASAIEALDGKTLDGRRLAVSEARPRKPREGGPPEHRGPRGPGPGGRPDPERQHRRPRFEGSADGPSGDRRPPRRDPGFSGPPPADPFASPGELSGKDEGRRRKKKWEDKGRPDDRDAGRPRDAGDRGRKRRGGGRRGAWNEGDDW